MTYHSKFRNSARSVTPSCAVVAAGLAFTLCIPDNVLAQGRYNDERPASNTISCSSDDGRRAYCDADTRGGVRLVRQLSGSPCEQGSTWGYDSRSIWVDRGCRAEFDLAGGGSQARMNSRAEMNMIEAGSDVSVRTNEGIDVSRSDGRVFSGTVDRDVIDSNGRLAIPRGSVVEMIVRSTSNQELILDLESVTVNGQRYAVTASTDGIADGQRDGIGKNARTGEFVGGGAVLGTVIGAIAGGGKGAAIGAAAGAGAGAGAQYLTRGRRVRVPAESLLTFRLEQPLQMGVADHGTDRYGHHYHSPNR